MSTSPIASVDLEPLLQHGGGDALPDGVLSEIRDACTDTGFLLVHGHGVEAPVVAALLGAARAFFALPSETKLDVAPRPWNADSPNAYRGYFPATADGKEGFDIGDPRLAELPEPRGRSLFHENNRFPDALGEDHVAAIARYFDALSNLGTRLAGAVVASLGGESERVSNAFPRPGSASTLRFNSYPYSASPHQVARDGTALCCASHVDNGILTILYQDESAGLEVRDRQGRWRDVPYDPEAFVVNTGLAFQQLTGGRLAATPHRVRQAAAERLSVPFFFEPRPDLRIDPAELGLEQASADPAETYAEFLDRAMRRFPEYDRPS